MAASLATQAEKDYLWDKMKKMLSSVWRFYRDGFRNQTWGRPLVWLVVLKLFILFAILRLFFFRPVLAGLDDAQKSEAVGTNLTRSVQPVNDTLTLN